MKVIGVLTKRQQELGLRVIEIDDHIVGLSIDKIPIASFSSDGAGRENLIKEARFVEDIFAAFLASDAFGEYATEWATEMGWKSPD